MCRLKYYLTLLQRKMISKKLDSSREPTQWVVKWSIDEAGIGIILWLQDQPFGEVDITLNYCKLRTFKCNMGYQKQFNCCGDILQTFVMQEERTEQGIMRCDQYLRNIGSAIHFNLTHVDIKMSRISILSISQMFVILHTLPAKRIFPTSLVIEESRSLYSWEMGGTCEKRIKCRNGVT